jgi:SAM-dependent methyltransferase
MTHPSAHSQLYTPAEVSQPGAVLGQASQPPLFATPPQEVPSLDDCSFYHVMDIPGHETVGKEWDLRPGVDDYLGHVAFEGKRVLEMGPASGFLTFEMERRGASLVSVEVTDEIAADFVPYPAERLGPIWPKRREAMRRLKNSYWFGHALHRSEALVYYGNVYDLPQELGRFDVAVIAAVLLHCHSPLKIVEQCARFADQIIITDIYSAELENCPDCRLLPTVENFLWHAWWRFSTTFFTQFLAVLGFTEQVVTRHFQKHVRDGTMVEFFTIVANKPRQA